MTVTGVDGRSAVLVAVRGRGWFASGADVRGVDEQTGLAVTADVTGWVRDVEVPELVGGLRTREGLEAALRRAVAAALVLHLVDNARQRMLTTEERERAGDLLAGRTTLAAPRVEPSPPVELPREPLTPRAHHVDERWGRRWTGTSREGEVRVVMTLLAGLDRLDADEHFLQTTSPEMLRHALREAFAEADRASGEELAR